MFFAAPGRAATHKIAESPFIEWRENQWTAEVGHGLTSALGRKRSFTREPDDLRKHNCLTLIDMPWRFAFPNEIRVVKIRGSWHSDNGQALVVAAVQGTGLVRFASYYVDEELASGELVPVLKEFEVQDAATWIIYPDRHHLPTRVRFLIDFLAERLGSDRT